MLGIPCGVSDLSRMLDVRQKARNRHPKAGIKPGPTNTNPIDVVNTIFQGGTGRALATHT